MVWRFAVLQGLEGREFLGCEDLVRQKPFTVQRARVERQVGDRSTSYLASTAGSVALSHSIRRNGDANNVRDRLMDGKTAQRRVDANGLDPDDFHV